MLYGCKLSPNRLSYTIAQAGFCLDTRSARSVAQGQGWWLFPSEAEAIAFDPYPPPPGRH